MLFELSRRFGIFTMLLTALLSVPATAKQEVALITDLHGEVSVLHNGQATKAKILQTLQKSWQLEVPRQARVELVFYANGETVTIQGPVFVEIDSDRAVHLSGPGDVRIHQGRASASLQEGAHSLTRLGGFISRESEYLDMTVELLAADSVRLSWITKPGFSIRSPYQVTVYRLDQSWVQSEELLHTSVNEDTVVWSEPFLKEDVTYRFEVQPTAGKQQSVDFRILSLQSAALVDRACLEAEELLASSPENPTPLLLLVGVLSSHGLFEEALEAMLRAQEMLPDAQEVKDLIQSLEIKAQESQVFRSSSPST